MEIRQYGSAIDLLSEVENFLVEKEAEYNLPLGIIRLLSTEEKKTKSIEEDIFLARGKSEDGEINIVLVRTPPRNLIICGQTTAVKETAKWLYEQQIYLPGVVGCSDIASAFAEAWSLLTKCEVKNTMKQQIYQLNQLKEFPQKPGRLSYATEDDIALIMSWTEEFEREALGVTEHVDLEKNVMNDIRNNRVFLWIDENCMPVSMAKRARELKNGVVVNFVYTPDEYKRKGYATTCVRALSERMLNEGFKFCSLNTDAKNPTSNSIYMKIGYEPVGSAIEYQFIY